MSKKSFYILLCLCIVLGVVLYVSESDRGSGHEGSHGPLFKDVDAAAVAALKIEQGPGNVVLKLKDGNWTVPGRGDYPADYAKIRTLLLKLLDLDVSQSITSSEDRYEGLGVSEEAAKKGNGIVTFLDAKDSPLFGIILGNLRKSSSKMSAMPGQGQYVRKVGDREVFLIGEPITVASDVKNWLSSEVVNILQNRIISIRQVRTSAGAETPEFLLAREGEAAPQQKFKLVEPAASAAELADSELALVRSGLENVSLSDVFKADDASVKDAAFDFTTSYTLEDGLGYRVQSAQKSGGDTFLVKISAFFDQDTANQSAQTAKVKAEAAKKAADEAAKETKDGDKPAPPAVPEFKPSSADEAAKVNSRFAPWIYELPTYQGKKFRVTLENLTKKAEKKE